MHRVSTGYLSGSLLAFGIDFALKTLAADVGEKLGDGIKCNSCFSRSSGIEQQVLSGITASLSVPLHHSYNLDLRTQRTSPPPSLGAPSLTHHPALHHSTRTFPDLCSHPHSSLCTFCLGHSILSSPSCMHALEPEGTRSAP